MEKIEYTAVAVDEVEEPKKEQRTNFGSPFKYESAFDFSSIAKFNKASFPSKSYFTFSKQTNEAKQNAAEDGCMAALLSGLVVFVTFSLALLTLPVTGWWTLRRLSQWQRLVVFRLGKVLPTRGPGWTLVLPGLDSSQLVDLRNRSILVPPQQLITCDGAVAELGAEVLYRVCDAHTFVGSCVDPQASLRSLCRTVLVNTLSSQELAAITRKAPETEEAILLSINSSLKDWGMEASSVKFSEVKVHKEAEQLSAVNPLLRQLGGMLGGGEGGLLGGGGGGGRTMVAGQAPLTASWLQRGPPPAQSDAATAAPLAAGTLAPLAEDAETAAALREAVARLPAGAGKAGLTAGVYRIETTAPDRLYHVLIGEGEREVRLGAAPQLTPDVTVTLSAADLRRLASGQLSPLAAYSGGRLRVQGNVHLLMALGTLFKEVGGAQ